MDESLLIAILQLKHSLLDYTKQGDRHVFSSLSIGDPGIPE
jgi:hypothetical protein